MSKGVKYHANYHDVKHTKHKQIHKFIFRQRHFNRLLINALFNTSYKPTQTILAPLNYF